MVCGFVRCSDPLVNCDHHTLDKGMKQEESGIERHHSSFVSTKWILLYKGNKQLFDQDKMPYRRAARAQPIIGPITGTQA